MEGRIAHRVSGSPAREGSRFDSGTGRALGPGTVPGRTKEGIVKECTECGDTIRTSTDPYTGWALHSARCDECRTYHDLDVFAGGRA